MPGTGTEIWWTLILGSATLLTVAVVFIATIALSQRRFVSIERQKLAALQEREQRFRSLLENSSDGITLMDAGGIILYESPSIIRVLGYASEELVGCGAFELMHPDDLGHAKSLFARLFERSGISVHSNLRYRHKDGSWRWIEGVSTNLLGDPNVNAIVVNYRDVTERKNAEERLKISHDQLRKLSARLQAVREEERTVIAREIHDELGQMLTVLKMDLALLQRKLPQNEPGILASAVAVDIKSMSAMIDSIIQSVRRIATELRPEVLDELGLAEAIEWEIEMFQNRTGIRTEFISSVDNLHLDRERSTALFRIFQETLTNVARHAQATRVKTRLDHENGALLLEVQDNGRGITERETSDIRSLGLVGMKERALLLGGELNIRGEEGGGTLVSVRIPFVPPLAGFAKSGSSD